MTFTPANSRLRQGRASTAAFLLLCLCALGANHESPNFSVSAKSPEMAKSVAELAEQHRGEIAREWFGKELQQWSTRCRITVSAWP